MSYTFTVEDVEREVRKLVAEEPDFVYGNQTPGTDPSCSYLGKSQVLRLEDIEGKGCIVGQALVRLGVAPVDLLPLEGHHAGTVLERLIDAGPSDSEWVMLVQSAQDRGVSWSVAVDEADGGYIFGRSGEDDNE